MNPAAAAAVAITIASSGVLSPVCGTWATGAGVGVAVTVTVVVGVGVGVGCGWAASTIVTDAPSTMCQLSAAVARVNTTIWPSASRSTLNWISDATR